MIILKAPGAVRSAWDDNVEFYENGVRHPFFIKLINIRDLFIAAQGRKEQPRGGEKNPAGSNEKDVANANHLSQPASQERAERHSAIREYMHTGIDATKQVGGNQLLAQTDLVDRVDRETGVAKKLGMAISVKATVGPAASGVQKENGPKNRGRPTSTRP